MHCYSVSGWSQDFQDLSTLFEYNYTGVKRLIVHILLGIHNNYTYVCSVHT